MNHPFKLSLKSFFMILLKYVKYDLIIGPSVLSAISSMILYAERRAAPAVITGREHSIVIVPRRIRSKTLDIILLNILSLYNSLPIQSPSKI